MPLKDVRLRPPVPKPGNIVCMAVNYMEDGTLKEKPQINAFHKAATAVIGEGDTMVLPDVPATIFEGEAELALVIGKRATRVSQADAMKLHLRLHLLHRRLGARPAAAGQRVLPDEVARHLRARSGRGSSPPTRSPIRRTSTSRSATTAR